MLQILELLIISSKLREKIWLFHLQQFFDVSMHHYKRVCPSVRPSVHPSGTLFFQIGKSAWLWLVRSRGGKTRKGAGVGRRGVRVSQNSVSVRVVWMGQKITWIENKPRERNVRLRYEWKKKWYRIKDIAYHWFSFFAPYHNRDTLDARSLSLFLSSSLRSEIMLFIPGSLRLSSLALRITEELTSFWHGRRATGWSTPTDGSHEDVECRC